LVLFAGVAGDWALETGLDMGEAGRPSEWSGCRSLLAKGVWADPLVVVVGDEAFGVVEYEGP
jgi:hypothetical protein